MRYLTFALSLFAFIFPATAHAENWWWAGYIGTAPNRTAYYVDLDSKAPLDKRTLSYDGLLVLETPASGGIRFQIVRYALRCNERKFSVQETYSFTEAAERIPFAQGNATDFVPIQAGSIGASMSGLICGQPSGNEIKIANPTRHAIGYFVTGELIERAESTDQTPKSSVGTGFFVSPDGLLLTSYHVVEGSRSVTCRKTDGGTVPLSFVRASAANDLALFSANGTPPGFLSLAPLGSTSPGDEVFTIGYGAVNFLGVSEPKYTDGTVSALSGLGAEDAYMQISVPVQPGNSGGPLVNRDGHVVGIVAAQAAVAAFMQSEGVLPQNINWAVKSDYAAGILRFTGNSVMADRKDALDMVRRSLCLIIAER